MDEPENYYIYFIYTYVYCMVPCVCQYLCIKHKTYSHRLWKLQKVPEAFCLHITVVFQYSFPVIGIHFYMLVI